MTKPAILEYRQGRSAWAQLQPDGTMRYYLRGVQITEGAYHEL